MISSGVHPALRPAAAPRVRVPRGAERRAKEILRNAGGGEVIIKARDGKIRDSDTVAPGNDPNAPKERKRWDSSPARKSLGTGSARNG